MTLQPRPASEAANCDPYAVAARTRPPDHARGMAGLKGVAAHGSCAVTAIRVCPEPTILRTYAAFLAGTSRMRWRRFLPANAAGGIAWADIYTLAAYLAGNTLRRLSGTIDLATGGAAILAVAAVLLIVRRQIGKLGQRAEAAYPGPLE
jgi:membrane protein DedA with SNARE-associated domain